MRFRGPSEAVALALLVCLGSGCAHSVARVAREWSLGSIRTDPARPVTVERLDAATVSVGIPLLADPSLDTLGGDLFVGPCTVLAMPVTRAQRDSLMALGDTAAPGLILLPVSPVGVSSLRFEPDGVQAARLSLTARLPVPADPGAVDEAAAGQPDPSLLVVLWAEPDSVASACPAPVSPPSPRAQADLVLVDFGVRRPIGGALAGGGMYVVAAVTLVTLLALAFGG